jgi:hypothetical protein
LLHLGRAYLEGARPCAVQGMLAEPATTSISGCSLPAFMRGQHILMRTKAASHSKKEGPEGPSVNCFGGPEGNRTPDLFHAKEARSRCATGPYRVDCTRGLPGQQTRGGDDSANELDVTVLVTPSCSPATGIPRMARPAREAGVPSVRRSGVTRPGPCARGDGGSLGRLPKTGPVGRSSSMGLPHPTVGRSRGPSRRPSRLRGRGPRGRRRRWIMGLTRRFTAW